MNLRFRALTLGALSLLIVFPTVTGAAPASPRPTAPRSPIVATRPVPDPALLYSAHARRLIRSYLRLRLLELREADLDRARAVIERRLRVDDLFVPPRRAPMVP